MVLLHSYHELVEKDPVKISPLWKVCQIILYTVAAFGGLTCAYTFGIAKIAFGNNCFLFARLRFLDGPGGKTTSTSTSSPNVTADVLESTSWEAASADLLAKANDTNTTTMEPITTTFLPLDLITSEWGNSITCDFVQFSSLISFILGCVWITMFWMCSRGGAGYATELHQPWRIVYPSMFFTLLVSIVMCINTMWMAAGIEVFCAEFESIFGTKECTPNINIYTSHFYDYEMPVATYLQVGIAGSSVSMFAWLLALALLVLRLCCVTDFDVITVNISSKENEDSFVTIHEADNKSITDSIISEDTQTDSLTMSKSYPISPPVIMPVDVSKLAKEVKFHLPSLEDDDSLAELGSESIDRPLLEAASRVDRTKINLLDAKTTSDTDSSISPIATRAVLDEFNEYDSHK